MNERLRELKKKFEIKRTISACLIVLLLGLHHISTGWVGVILGLCTIALVWFYIARLYYKFGCDITREISMIRNLYMFYLENPPKVEELEDGTVKLTYTYDRDFDYAGLYDINYYFSISGTNNQYKVITTDKFTDAENGNVIMYAKKFDKNEIKVIKDYERQSI